VRIRPLAEEDVGRAARLLWAALPPHGEDGDARMRAKLAQGLAHDPEGFLVAEDEDGLTGIALAVRREEIWVLAWLGVHPGARSAGVGGRLLEAALAYGAGCRGFLIASSDDARAMRLYAQAGFDVHPSVLARGRASPERAPDLSRVREGGAEDVEHCVRIDRAVRGGGRGIDVTAWLDSGDRLWRTPSGYAVGRQGRPMTVAGRRGGGLAPALARSPGRRRGRERGSLDHRAAGLGGADGPRRRAEARPGLRLLHPRRARTTHPLAAQQLAALTARVLSGMAPTLGNRTVPARAAVASAVARVIGLVTVVVCVLIVVGILLVVLGANLDNAIAGRLHTWADTLTNPFHALFTPNGHKLRVTVNWGLALVVYFAIGRVLAAGVRRAGRV